MDLNTIKNEIKSDLIIRKIVYFLVDEAEISYNDIQDITINKAILLKTMRNYERELDEIREKLEEERDGDEYIGHRG